MPPRVTNTRQLFSKGQVTDLDTSDLAPDQAEALRDAIWSANGDLAKRGGFLYATGANPNNGNTDELTSCVLTEIPDATDPNTYTQTLVVGDTTRFGVLTGYGYGYGSANTSTTTSTRTIGYVTYPLMDYGAEVLMAVRDDDRVQLFRWGKSMGTEDATPSGTITVTTGSDQVTGVGTSFTTEVAVGQYIWVASNGVWMSFLVEFIGSNTSLRISSRAQVTISAASYQVVNVGFANISTLVTNKGLVTTGVGSATGSGTSWNTGLRLVNLTAISPGDWICGEAGTTRYGVGGVVSDTSLSITGTPGLTSSNYVIGRNLVGHVVANHGGRLWVAGVPWAPNRVQVTPVAYNLNDVFNGVDSSTTDPDNAAVIESVEIPDDASAGYVTALVSGNDPGPLLVLRDRDAHIIYGEWPSIQVTKLGDDIGCVDFRAATFHGSVFYWAGLEGVFSYTPGGGVRNLTEGRIYREWKANIGAFKVLRSAVAVVNRTLFVSITVDDGAATNYGWMLDLDRDAWSSFTDAKWGAATPVVVAGEGRDVFVTELATNRVVSLRSATDPTLAGAANSLTGSFLARSGRMLLGSAGQLGRVIGARLTYRMTGSSPQFTVKFGSTSLQTAATVTTTTSGTAYATTRIKPTLNLGAEFRDVQVEFAESSGTPTRLELNEFQWVTRERRVRA